MSRTSWALLLSLTLALPAAAGEPGVGVLDPEYQAREYFTDTVLLDQNGKQVRFYTDVVKDKTILLSFAFTRCKTACPLIVQKLNQIRASLGGRLGKDVHFVTISVDPGYDTPKALREFIKKQRADHPGWTFLTGDKASVDAVLKKLGTWNEDLDMHSTAFIAGNAKTRRWTKVRPDMPPGMVAEHVRGLADGQLAAQGQP